MRGVAYLSDRAVRIGPGSALMAVSGEGKRPNEVLWFHKCRVADGWTACGLDDHTLSGRLEDGNLTIRASLLCPDGCGKHGFVTDNVWSEA